MTTRNNPRTLLRLVPIFASLLFCVLAFPALGQQRWSEAKANAWYAQQPYLVGSNYIPDDAINQLEMWQAATFDPKEIDRELGWAQGLGMNTMRVLLHDLLWEQDPDGFKRRINVFLTIAARHHIRPIFVLFDSCWDPNPELGPQHPPIPGVHNSGWVQSPGRAALTDPAQYPRLKAYVQGVIGAFGNDPRVLAWDLWNEPDNQGGDVEADVPAKVKRVDELLPKVFEWARQVKPMQPLTSGVWTGNWSDPAKESETTKIQLSESDVISFHNYDWPEVFEARIHELRALHRPLICTEYMARGNGSTFDTILPIGKREHVALINWGLVNGKTQTNLPWYSWKRPYVEIQPTIWFHDVFRSDDTPYREREAELLRQYTERGFLSPEEKAAQIGAQ